MNSSMYSRVYPFICAYSDVNPTSRSDVNPTSGSDVNPMSGFYGVPTSFSDVNPSSGSDVGFTSENDVNQTFIWNQNPTYTQRWDPT